MGRCKEVLGRIGGRGEGCDDFDGSDHVMCMEKRDQISMSRESFFNALVFLVLL